ncbi:MAG: metal ABC transporter permease [Deltaproteobacteria bacterium]|nr:metal ABC transporter permease [Deltaproteobacteria bacterium]
MIASFVASWPLFHDAYLAGCSIALLLALLGVVVVTRDQIFFGAAVAQASVLGIAVAVSVGGLPVLAWCAWCDDDWTHTLVGGVFAVAGALATATAHPRGESPEALTGWVFLTGSSFAVLLLAHSPHGMDEINRLLASTIIGASAVDVALLTVLFAVTAAAAATWSAPLRLVLMDPEMASAVGLRIGTWHRALAIALGVAMGLAIHVSGVVFSFGFLVLPALVAKQLCREVGQMLWVSPLVGLVAAITGFVVANDRDLPPGQAAVAVLCVLLATAWTGRRLRGR